MAMLTFTTVWVPRIRLMTLARMPILRYLLKPKQAAMHTAKGAESWNSQPGMMLGSLNMPNTANRVANKAVTVISLVFINIPLSNQSLSRHAVRTFSDISRAGCILIIAKERTIVNHIFPIVYN